MEKDDFILLLNEKWNCNIPFGWIPIYGEDSIPNSEIFYSDSFDDYIENVKSIIKETFDVVNLYELREDGQFKEINVNESDFHYDGLEYIYTDSEFKFILYFSHENSSAIGGEKLLNEIHKIWPNYREHFWKPHESA